MTENLPGDRAMKPGDVLTRAQRHDHRGAEHRRRGPPRPGRRAQPRRRGQPRRDHRRRHADRRPDASRSATRSARILATTDELAALRRGRERAQRRAAVAHAARRRYDAHLDSDVADLKNIGKPGQRRHRSPRRCSCGASPTGGPWAHLDIAGPARAESDARLHDEGRDGLRRCARSSSYLEAVAAEPRRLARRAHARRRGGHVALERRRRARRARRRGRAAPRRTGPRRSAPRPGEDRARRGGSRPESVAASPSSSAAAGAPSSPSPASPYQ